MRRRNDYNPRAARDGGRRGAEHTQAMLALENAAHSLWRQEGTPAEGSLSFERLRRSKFTPSCGLLTPECFAVCGRRRGLLALDLGSFLKKAPPKTSLFPRSFLKNKPRAPQDENRPMGAQICRVKGPRGPFRGSGRSPEISRRGVGRSPTKSGVWGGAPHN